MNVDPDLDEVFFTRNINTPERQLWTAALCQLIRDANMYQRKPKAQANLQHEFKAAHDDLFNCGKMTRYVCRWLDLEPEYVSKIYRGKLKK
tara:strand:+ start:16976 stop:17248 length:273 start_codon:yes stop_codon:yes gene_type:complete